ncbi:MAG: hypothetical protein ACXWYF_07435 [Actinomycetota bacterium]
MRGRIRPGAAVAAAVFAAVVFQPASAAPMTMKAPVPGSSCRVFPSDNVWNMDVSKLPIAKKNEVWKRSMHAGSTRLHPDFGPPAYGTPFDVVDDSHQKVHIDFAYGSESDPGPYPFGSDTHIEDGSDRHALMIDGDTCTLYELYAAEWNGGQPTAGSGAIFHLEGADANDLRPVTWTSADAAGLPIFPGLVRWDEVNAGAIQHAIRFTVDCTSRRYLWPARHQAGSSDRRCPPMGARFRLKAGFDLSSFGGEARVILTAMKHSGLIVADNGSDWYFQGEVNPHWTNDLMDELKSIPAGAFVAVDESGCRVSPDSAAFAYGLRCPAP